MIPSLSSLLLRPRTLCFALLPSLLLATLSVGGCVGKYQPSTATTLPDDVKATIRDAVDQGHRTGVLVALVNDQGVHLFSYPETPTSTVYGIGSLTKVFTALLLADLADQGELELDSQVNRYLPEDLHIPSRDGADLTLLHLATHTSGLPKEPKDWDWTTPESPNEILRFAQSYDYPGPYGSQYAYSNLGMALLGRVMEIKMQEPLADLVEERVIGKLGLQDTTYDLGTEQQRRLATPHLGSEAISPDQLRVPEAAHAAGGLYSTADDLLRFLEWNLAPESSGLASALESTQRTLGETDEANLHMGLGWKIYESDGMRIVHHGGQSAGHQSFLGFVRDRGVGVLLLADSRADDGLDQVALYLLTGNVPLPDFSHPKEVNLASERLETYVGRYQVDEDNLVEIAVRDGRLLYTETTASGKVIRETTIYASSETEFYFTDIPVTLVFDRASDPSDPSPGLTLYLPDDQALAAQRVQ